MRKSVAASGLPMALYSAWVSDIMFVMASAPVTPVGSLVILVLSVVVSVSRPLPIV